MHSDLQRTREVIDRAVDGLTLEELCWHTDGKWCAAEILEHLSLTFGGTAKGLARVAAGGTSAASVPKVKQRVAAWVVTTCGVLPRGRKSPQQVVPRGMPADQVLAAIRKNLADMDEAINSCESAIGTKIRIADHPVLGPLTAKQWRKFHFVHTRHHMEQIAALRAQMKGGQSKP